MPVDSRSVLACPNGSAAAGRDAFDSNEVSYSRGYFAESPDGRVIDKLADQRAFQRPQGMQFSRVTLAREVANGSTTIHVRRQTSRRPLSGFVRHRALR